ncbi:signal peptidase II [Pseudalkalibacillus berkeleyi]|uniref:Lipoprotein signal peptidase n=1 Tax=Pseudalkalibacillus berkeleyi TaxID=1069813 RepID=A0ABS9GZW3_9BACL|nr:signal peptidase II [Pseudalkalibacillus berkeleyi]MCF6137033.1 signal peptidase II [Pseudalkalibacillus berkeleyi]
MVRYYLLALFVLITDQLTKWLIVRNMELGEQVTIIENLFYIQSHRNRGAAFGILQGQMWLFIIVTIVVMIAVIYYLHTEAIGNDLLSTSLALILGGAVGNFIDRLFRGEVVDFLDFYIINYDFPIFNIADSALVIGVGLIAIAFLLEGRTSKEN